MTNLEHDLAWLGGVKAGLMAAEEMTKAVANGLESQSNKVVLGELAKGFAKVLALFASEVIKNLESEGKGDLN
jgi:hypothetical protein